MKLLRVLVVLLLGFILGLLVMDNQWFPYSQLKTFKQTLSAQTYQPSDQEIRYYSRKVSVHKLMSGQGFDAVFIGDSLIDEMDWAQLFPDSRVANFGINADTTAGLLKRIDTVESVEVERIFILIGVNDLLQGNVIAEIESNYKMILDYVKGDGRAVYFLSVLPLGEKYQELNAKVRMLNQLLQGLAKTHSSVQFIDLSTGVSLAGQLNPLYTNDDLHLNGKGYRQVARLLEPYLY